MGRESRLKARRGAVKRDLRQVKTQVVLRTGQVILGRNIFGRLKWLVLGR